MALVKSIAGNEICDSKARKSRDIPDTRNNNQSPSWYMANYPKQVITEFKIASKIGLYEESYAVLETTVPWPDPSGGYPKQRAMISNKIYWRVGTSDAAWGSWQSHSVKTTDDGSGNVTISI